MTGSGNCSSMNLVSGLCIRPTGIVAGLSTVKVFEFIFSREFWLARTIFHMLVETGRDSLQRLTLPYLRSDSFGVRELTHNPEASTSSDVLASGTNTQRAEPLPNS